MDSSFSPAIWPAKVCHNWVSTAQANAMNVTLDGTLVQNPFIIIIILAINRDVIKVSEHKEVLLHESMQPHSLSLTAAQMHSMTNYRRQS